MIENSSRDCITAKVLFITRQKELVRKKEFIAVAFHPKNEIFIVHVAFLAICD